MEPVRQQKVYSPLVMWDWQLVSLTHVFYNQIQLGSTYVDMGVSHPIYFHGKVHSLLSLKLLGIDWFQILSQIKKMTQ